MGSGGKISGERARTFAKGSSGDCLVQALAARGVEYRYLRPAEITNTALLGRPIIEFDISGVRYYFDDGTLRSADPGGKKIPGPNINGRSSARFAWRKDLVKLFLSERGFSVPEGAAFCRKSLQDAEVYFESLSRSVSGICLKPAAANRGRHVFLGVRERQLFCEAFAAISKNHTRVLIEEMVAGETHRFTCVSGRVVAIRIGRPANVMGDGNHTIIELVARKNAERQLNPCHARYPLRLGERERAFLANAGLNPELVPSAGRRVFLSDLSNLHHNADIVDVTDAVHPSYIELVEQAVRLIPGLLHCGPDVIIEDARLPATRDNYHILELNANGPGFGAHHHPLEGRPRDVAGALVNCLTERPIVPLPEMRERRRVTRKRPKNKCALNRSAPPARSKVQRQGTFRRRLWHLCRENLKVASRWWNSCVVQLKRLRSRNLS